MPKPSRILLGAMSGTSADGVDVVAARISGTGLTMQATILASASAPLPAALRSLILQMRRTGKTSLADLARLGRDLTLTYAKASLAAMRKAHLSPADVAAIAAHGQTLFHAPPLTIQYFDPALLAIKTGCTVISDFRRADCALGGQGAPLVPFADYLLFRHPSRNRVLLNIGGIANITFLPAGGTLSDVIAFDTGPGNCISDTLAEKLAGKPFDPSGKLAAEGAPDDAAADAFLSHPYFDAPAPKSTDGPAMLAIWRSLPRLRRLKPHDALASACLITARAIAMSIRHQLPASADELLIAGGGVRNRTLITLLSRETALPIATTAEFGIPAQSREALAFALLGAATLDGIPANVPSVTGASRPAILGSITRNTQSRRS